uniref:YEATS domain-containing protein n=1 Tax=Scylla olivacea TaxID=85551 RepID=A0A0P4W0D9_SCYOL
MSKNFFVGVCCLGGGTVQCLSLLADSVDLGMAQAQIQQQQQKGNQSADFGPDSGGRIKGLTIVKPLIYGNVARYFGKKREEDGHTHEWTVYVKPYNNEDMSNYVKQIHFKLHESYADQNRMLTAPPYEVTETGWGEFEIVIKIYFHDPNERPVSCWSITSAVLLTLMST